MVPASLCSGTRATVVHVAEMQLGMKIDATFWELCECVEAAHPVDTHLCTHQLSSKLCWFERIF